MLTEEKRKKVEEMLKRFNISTGDSAQLTDEQESALYTIFCHALYRDSRWTNSVNGVMLLALVLIYYFNHLYPFLDERRYELPIYFYIASQCFLWSTIADRNYYPFFGCQWFSYIKKNNFLAAILKASHEKIIDMAKSLGVLHDDIHKEVLAKHVLLRLFGGRSQQNMAEILRKILGLSGEESELLAGDQLRIQVEGHGEVVQNPAPSAPFLDEVSLNSNQDNWLYVQEGLGI